MATLAMPPRPSVPGWRQVLAGGILAGVAFGAFEMVMAVLVTGTQAFLMPLRMIGAMALGRPALEPDYSLAAAATTGAVIHLVLSVVFALVFAWLARAAFVPAESGLLLMAATADGVVLWLVNFYVIAPRFGWTWFPNRRTRSYRSSPTRSFSARSSGSISTGQGRAQPG